MIQHITAKITYGCKSLADFIREENLKVEAFLSLLVVFFILFVLL